MIIWHGGGIFVILTAALGAVAYGFLAPLIASMGFQSSVAAALTVSAAATVAFLANWLLCKCLYREGNRSYHSLFFIPAKAFTVIYALAIPAGGYMGWSGANESQAELAKYPGIPAFEAANKLITSSSNGTASGNTEEAKIAADALSAACTKLAPLMFSGGSKMKGLSGGSFLVYCQRTKEGAVFLVHVPDLRHYKDADVKETLGDMVWGNAQIAAKMALKLPDNAAVAVGLRGIASYGMVWLGRVSGDPVLKDDDSSAKKRLYDWFDPARQSTAAPVTPPTAPALSK